MPKKKRNPEKVKRKVEEEAIPKEEAPRKAETVYLETNLDKFYDLVRERQSMNFDEAAGKFGVDRKQIASWAKILEEHKLVVVHYPFFGVPSVLFREKEKKGLIKEEGEKEKNHKKKAPKILVALAGGFMVLLGYVMVVSNPFTTAIKSQIAGFFGRIAGAFRLPFPLNIITPVAIIMVAALAFLAFRRRKATGKSTESKLSKIKKELETK